MPHPRYTLLRLDPPSPSGDRGPRQSPAGFFATLGAARRETLRLNRRARERGALFRWRYRSARPGEGGGMTGF